MQPTATLDILDHVAMGDRTRRLLKAGRASTIPPLLLIDFRVYCWRLLSMAETVAQIPRVSDAVYRDWIKASWAIMLGNGPFCLPTDHNWTVVILDDDGSTKEYWRKPYLRERGFPEYKGSRPPQKPDALTSIAQIGLEYISAEVSKYFYLSLPGYEADDLAGTALRLKMRARAATRGLLPTDVPVTAADRVLAERLMVLSTCDTDWLQLVTPDVIWCNTGPHAPRIRGMEESIAYVKRRFKLTIKLPSQIAGIKARRGDSSDDLRPGSPLEVIDLINPPINHRPEETALRSKLDAALSYKYSNIPVAHYEKCKAWIQSRGLPMPI